MAELERLVASSQFRSSKRYPAMLRFVVEKTLAGDIADVKERTIGIEVFGRPLDYDTNSDPVVRFSAGEVRKRIAQQYREEPEPRPVEFALPLGSYIPQFQWVKPNTDTPETEPVATVSGVNQEMARISAEMETRVLHAIHHQTPEPPLVNRRNSILLGAAIGAVLMLAATAIFFAIPRRAPVTPVSQVWAPLLDSSGQVLISAGRPHPGADEPAEPADTTIGTHIMRPEFRMSFPTSAAISHVAGLLQSHQKAFQIREAYSTTLQDLHGRPTVLVTGTNNKWTVLLLQPLRFHFTEENEVGSIVDNQHPENHDWTVDFKQPYLKQTTDYALVARFYDATTGGPVLVIAGISSNGTDAAGEFIVSPQAIEKLAKLAPHGSLDQNFEAVLRVEVINGNTGAATVVASQFW